MDNEYSEADYQEFSEPEDPGVDLETRVEKLEKVVEELKKIVENLRNQLF